MADREQILEMLRTERECVCRDCDRECGKCDLAKERCWLLDMYDGAIELLTPVEPERLTVLDFGEFASAVYLCGACRMPIERGDVYCKHCGGKVKWDG